MSNNRKKNLKRLARNIVGATAALSSLAPVSTNANEVTASNGSSSVVPTASLGIAGVSAIMLGTGTYLNYKNNQITHADDAKKQKLAEEQFEWTKKTTPDSQLMEEGLRGTGIDAKTAAQAYLAILHLPRKAKSKSTLKQDEFVKILLEKDTLGGKIATAVYDIKNQNIPGDQTACNRAVYKTVAEFLRGGSKVAAEALTKIMASKNWVEGKKPEKIVEGLGTIGMACGNAHNNSIMFKSLEFRLDPLAQNLIVDRGLYAITTSKRKNGNAAGANEVLPGATQYYGPEKLTDMNYEIGNSWLGGSSEKLLKDALPMTFAIPKLPAWSGMEDYVSTNAGVSTRDQCKAGLLGKKDLADANLDPFIKSNVMSGIFNPNLLVGNEITTAAGGINAIGGGAIEHRYFVPLNSAKGEWTWAKITEGRKALGNTIGSATMVEPKPEEDDEGLKL